MDFFGINAGYDDDDDDLKGVPALHRYEVNFCEPPGSS